MTPTPTNKLAALIGSWLLLEGTWGMFNPVVLGFITTNRLRASIHLCLAVAALWTAFTSGSRKYLWIAGPIILTVGLLYFVPAAKGITDLLAVNLGAALANCVVGLSALTCAAKYGHDVRPIHR